MGKAIGEIGIGLVQMALGVGGSFVGGGMSTTGGGAIVGVPIAVASAGMLVNGYAAVGVGIDGFGQAWSEGSGSPSWAPTLLARRGGPSSDALGRALEKAGHARPPGAAVHHIVAGNAPAAQRARDILAKFGIGMDDAANGVFLPATRAAPNPTGAAVHSTLHTNTYYQTVNQMLDTAKTQAEAEAILQDIRNILLSGGF
ncbi:AHH domain-containing protein [Polyangium fumosum]|uniref:Uncharacterized protein n=1 Tax=Polyangium fumosum TaxID=889272 RepID=A0A4U1JJC1_9BACT|nr:AHH domain-containing protein [Polyangium fumosum]TKD12807.1 hypothetical protein E8A74_03410 [Polyangium fumosum]